MKVFKKILRFTYWVIVFIFATVVGYVAFERKDPSGAFGSMMVVVIGIVVEVFITKRRLPSSEELFGPHQKSKDEIKYEYWKWFMGKH